MKTNFSFAALLIFGLLLFEACTPKGTLPRDNEGREDFKFFINKFYSDINFQLERVDFPITGKMQEDGRPQIIEKEEWSILKPIDPNDAGYKIYNRNIAHDLIEQQIVVKGAFSIEMQFTLNQTANEWYLTSYTGVSGVAATVKVDSMMLDSTRKVGFIRNDSPDSFKKDK